MKWYTKQRLFEVMEKVNPDFLSPEDNSWAIFRVSKGYGKCFVTSLSGVMKDSIGTCDYRVKYSDPSVMKFTLERAKEIIKKNIWIDDKLGVVNDKGIQKLFNWRIKYEDKYPESEMLDEEEIENKPKLILPVGISGSGKSTWIKSQTDSNTVVVSPDDIRRELTGNISDQTKNGEVFQIAHKRVADALNAGKNVIFDATNIKSRDRKSLMNYMKVHVDKPFEGFAKVFSVDPEVAKQRVRKDIEAGVDRSNVPDWAIDKQHRSFVDDMNTIELDGFKIMDENSLIGETGIADLSKARLLKVRREVKKIDPYLDVEIDSSKTWKTYWLIDKSKKTTHSNYVSYELIVSFSDEYHSPIGQYDEYHFQKMIEYFKEIGNIYIQNGRKY